VPKCLSPFPFLTFIPFFFPLWVGCLRTVYPCPFLPARGGDYFVPEASASLVYTPFPYFFVVTPLPFTPYLNSIFLCFSSCIIEPKCLRVSLGNSLIIWSNSVSVLCELLPSFTANWLPFRRNLVFRGLCPFELSRWRFVHPLNFFLQEKGFTHPLRWWETIGTQSLHLNRPGWR